MLSTMPAKLAAYAADTYFLECAEQLGDDRETFARTNGLLLLKPDAIVARAVEPTLEWLRDNGFRVAAACRIGTDRHLVRALWYFQWNIASPERRRLADLLLTISDSLLLVVADDATVVPTTVRLTDRKGPTAPAKRAPGELRHLLGGSTYLLNFVHTTDEPADVIRELGIYLSAPERDRLVSDMAAGTDHSATAATIGTDLYSATPARSFDTATAKRALLPLVPHLDEAASDTAWAQAFDGLWNHADPWDLLVVGAAVLPMRTAEGTQTLGAAPMSSWLEEHDEREGGLP